MIIKSRVTGKWVLEIFESFRIDRLLPKYAPKEKIDVLNHSKYGNSDSEDMSEHINNNISWRSANGSFDVPMEIHPWRRKFVSWLERVLKIAPTKSVKDEIPSGKTNPLQILLSVRGSLKEMQDYINRVRLYDEVIKQAKAAGQIARVEQLMLARKIVQMESLLMATGIKQYLSEDTVVEFAEKCQKGLRLDWVCNFTRPIPADVLAKKVEADQLKVFDNYVIMHYDPGQTAFALTKQQEEAKKDPILFGVIEGVRKLYFIGDWKDDECSLTMDEVAQVLGKQASEINDDPTKE